MTNKDLIQAFEIIDNSGKGWFKGPMPEEIIIKAEKYLHIDFSISFKEFLREKGNGFFNGREFYGLVGDDFTKGPIPDAIWLTMNERQKAGLDKNLILICESPSYFYAIDTRQNINGENPIIDIIPGAQKEKLEIVAPDYGVFFLNEIRSVS